MKTFGTASMLNEMIKKKCLQWFMHIMRTEKNKNILKRIRENRKGKKTYRKGRVQEDTQVKRVDCREVEEEQKYLREWKRMFHLNCRDGNIKR